MRRVLPALVGVCAIAALEAFAQGTIIFDNVGIPRPSGVGVYDAPMTLSVEVVDLQGNFLYAYDRGLGPGWVAGLFQEGSQTALATTTFVTEFGPDYYWMLANPREVRIPGVQPGTTARLYVATWRENDPSMIWGRSQAFTSLPLGGQNPVPGEPPFFTPGMTGLERFWSGPLSRPYLITEVVPEPTTGAMAVAGIAMLGLARRRG